MRHGPNSIRMAECATESPGHRLMNAFPNQTKMVIRKLENGFQYSCRQPLLLRYFWSLRGRAATTLITLPK